MDFNQLLQAGTAHAWLYIPVAIILGALHGLEPGHSKTMMAAFIIAIRGTALQAALLGLCAAISHSLVIWLLAGLALKYGSQWNAESTEPYFLLISGIIVVGMALCTISRLKSDSHHHHHHDETRKFTTPEGDAILEIFEDGVPPVFRLKSTTLKPQTLRTIRDDGTTQVFTFKPQGDGWESTDSIPEPHGFKVELTLQGSQSTHALTTEFVEHSHDDLDDDAHAQAHAADIEKRFANRSVTTGQIVLFGLTGGLMPCPAAVSILIICLQLKQFTLGFGIVAAFSFGLALTLISVGVLASWGFKKMTEKSGWAHTLAHRAPYLSSYLLILLGLVFVARGLWMMN